MSDMASPEMGASSPDAGTDVPYADTGSESVGTAVLERPALPDAPPPALVRERSEIDRSCAVPCLVWFASSLFWLIVGTLLGILASLKMHSPGLLAEQAWLDVRPDPPRCTSTAWPSAGPPWRASASCSG